MGSYARWALGLFFVFARLAAAQSGVLTTVAGTTSVDGVAVRGYSGDGGPAAQATLALANVQNDCDPGRWEQTNHISVDGSGNVYVSDAQNHRIRRIGADGNITTIIGSGQTPAINTRCEPTGPVGDGEALGARLYSPASVVAHPDGRIIFADQMNNRIRQLRNGVVSTIVGSGAHNLYAPGIPATSSPMDWPSSVAVDGNGLIYFAELHGNRVGRIETDGRLSTIAGTGFPGAAGDNGPANRAGLNKPASISFDRAGNLYIADTGNHRIRKVSGGTITTIAGTGQAAYCGDGGRAEQACLQTPMDVRVDAAGNVYIADTGNHRVRRIDAAGTITTVAGTGVPGRGADGVAATVSALNAPSSLAIDAANDVYIVDWQNYLIRKLSFGVRPVIAENGVVHALSFRGSIAPGGLISVFGSNLAAETATASTAPWTVTLGGSSVRVNGVAIPLSFVSAGQINGQLPYETPLGAADVVVAAASGESAAARVTVTAAAPGILQHPGTQRAVALQVNGSLNAPDSPAARGSAITIFVTGVGVVDFALANGEAAPFDRIVRPLANVTATIGGVESRVLFAGLMPGLVGVAQAVVAIPEAAPIGEAVALVIEMAGEKSNLVEISIR